MSVTTVVATPASKPAGSKRAYDIGCPNCKASFRFRLPPKAPRPATPYTTYVGKLMADKAFKAKYKHGERMAAAAREWNDLKARSKAVDPAAKQKAAKLEAIKARREALAKARK